jgi:hypothetical protein
VFTDSIGELEPIIQSKIADLKRVLFDFELSDAQREQRMDQTLAAIEEQRRTHDEIENAASFLASTDEAEIDGFEEELVTNGRYVGQPELALLVKDWADTDPGSSCRVAPDATHIVLRGSPKLEAELMAVQAAGERSAVELENLARYLRNELELWVCLDQELARVTNAPLLTTNHPLVRAALRVPGHHQVRFAHLAITAEGLESGRYVLLLSLARWTGLRSSRELWSSAVSIDQPDSVPTSAVGAAVLAALAAGTLAPARPLGCPDGLAECLQRATDDLLDRQLREEARRAAVNASLIDTRRISLEETFSRKCDQIRTRIATLRRENKTRTIHLHEAQLRNQDRALTEELAKLDASRQGAMQVEPLAVALVTVS